MSAFIRRSKHYYLTGAVSAAPQLMNRNMMLLLAGFWLYCLPVTGQPNGLTERTVIPAHPRLLLLTGEEQALKKSIAADTAWATLHRVILTESDALLPLAPVEHVKVGKRLLDKSREALRRVFFLAYAWRMTHDPNYLKRGEAELLAISGFSDWNPSHFLDVAEMTMAAAIGYDWLYDALPEPSRKAIREAILKKGVEPSLDPKNNGWLRNTNNWNQVCNAGMMFGAIAVYEDNPVLARQVINRAIETVVVPMGEYSPDGAYPEGYGYWGYGTSFNVMLISALEKLTGSDFGLSQQPGFLKTAGYLENMTGPTGNAFNYFDSGMRGGLQPAMFWFAHGRHSDRTGNPSLLWNEQTYLRNPAELKRQGQNRLLPATLLWGQGLNLNRIVPPTPTVWTGGGRNPVALLRTAWTDSAAIFVGIKGGSPGLSHGHMDAGSFVMEADGVRWAMDFGMQDYNSLESNGVDLWNMKQDSPRWQVFRYANFVHNTLTVNNSLQRVDGQATLTGSSANAGFRSARIDLTGLYSPAMKQVNRGIAIVNSQYVAVRDELSGGPAETTVRWTMLTPATVRLLDGNRAELTKNGKKLILQVTEPATVSLKTWPTDPPHAYDAPNPGTTLVGFELTVPANTKANLTVLLLPEKAADAGTIPPGRRTAVKPLAQWPR